MHDPSIIIIGAGAGGMGMAIKLMEAGYSNITILERASGVGGTWYHNRYPGCECDIPSHLYSYSFELNPGWSKPYATQPEILAYLERVAEKYGIYGLCQFNTEVVSAQWDEGSAQWQVHTAAGKTHSANFLVSAIGMFSELSYPDIPGLDSFAGKAFHSARWDHEHALEGRRVAVVGSAASAIQFLPKIAEQAGHIDYFQRTANWVLPKDDVPFTQEQLDAFYADPELVSTMRREIFEGINGVGPRGFDGLAEDMQAFGLASLEVVEDPEVRAKLVPTHPWGCKRPLFANDYYPAFNRPNLNLVTTPIAAIEPGGVRTDDGQLYEADTLILATGFKTTAFLAAIDVTGRDGLSIGEAWADGAIAYKGVTTAGFPNLFMLYGPNTNGDSLITMIEFHIEHTVKHIQRLTRDNLDWVEVKKDVMDRWNDTLQREIAEIGVWFAGCSDYYRAPSGRVVTQWPKTMGEHGQALEQIDIDAYLTG